MAPPPLPLPPLPASSPSNRTVRSQTPSWMSAVLWHRQQQQQAPLVRFHACNRLLVMTLALVRASVGSFPACKAKAVVHLTGVPVRHHVPVRQRAQHAHLEQRLLSVAPRRGVVWSGGGGAKLRLARQDALHHHVGAVAQTRHEQRLAEAPAAEHLERRRVCVHPKRLGGGAWRGEGGRPPYSPSNAVSLYFFQIDGAGRVRTDGAATDGPTAQEEYRRDAAA